MTAAKVAASPKSIATRMFDAIVRVEQMFWLPGLANSAPSEFRDFIEDDLPDEKELLKQLPWLKRLIGDEDFRLEKDEYAIEFYRNGCNGFLVQLARPIPTDFLKEGRGYSFSWGYYQCRWFYFETLDALCDRAEKWSAEVVEKARAKSKPRAKAATP